MEQQGGDRDASRNKTFSNRYESPALKSTESEILAGIFAYILANFITTHKIHP